MTTSSLDLLKNLMRDMQRRQQQLGVQLNVFNALQEEIAELQRRATSDLSARKRLLQLERAIGHDIEPLGQRIHACVDQLQRNFKSLEASLQSIGKAGAQKPAEIKTSFPLLEKNFI